MTNLEIEGPLANLLKSKRVIKELGTTTPCPGSKYTELFQKKSKVLLLPILIFARNKMNKEGVEMMLGVNRYSNKFSL